MSQLVLLSWSDLPRLWRLILYSLSCSSFSFLLLVPVTGFVHSAFAGFVLSLLCLSFLFYLAFCFSTYSANFHLLTVVRPCLLLIPVVWLLILGLFCLMISLVLSFSISIVFMLAFCFGLWLLNFSFWSYLTPSWPLRLVSLSPLVQVCFVASPLIFSGAPRVVNFFLSSCESSALCLVPGLWVSFLFHSIRLCPLVRVWGCTLWHRVPYMFRTWIV